jgi:Uma2 family endonuclease
MAPVTSADRGIPASRCVVLRGIRWPAYVTIADAAAGQHVRFTYDRGALEIMTLSPEHEFFKVCLFRIVEILTEEFDLPNCALGSTTFRREDLERGLEPDECFYLGNWERVAGKTRLDLSIDPPPDLAVEIDVTHSSIPRSAIYAAFGVPELWRFDGESLRFFRLTSKRTYRQTNHSNHFPNIASTDLADFLHLAVGQDGNAWKRRFRGWVRERIAAGE